MDTQKLLNLAIGAGILWAAWKFASNPTVKTMVLGVAGGFIAKQVPYVNQYV